MAGARIAYQPALDGVRALAVAAVLLFHAGTTGFDGGYLGVSVFFTLSGYLITSLLVNEHEETGTVDLAAFYGRRLRRLLPASLATVAVIVVIAATTDVFERVNDLRTHVFGAVFQVANWVFLSGEGSYQDLLAQASGTASPLEHFWSLAIEEQFYWVWPFVVMFAFGRIHTRRGRLRALTALTVAAMISAPVIAQAWGPDAAYWATPARLSEILIGGWVALALGGRAIPVRAGYLAPGALLVLGGCVVLFPSSSGPAYEGALPLVAVVSGALLIGLQVDGPVRRVLSLAPFVWLGKISYGVYLFHWPIYVLVDADRTGWSGFPLTVVRLGLTLAVATASYALLEQPIRRTRRNSFRPTFGLAVASTVVVAVVAVALVPAGLGNYWQVDDEVAEAAAIEVVDAPLTALAATTTTVPRPTTAPPTSAPSSTTVNDADAVSAVDETVPPSTEPVEESTEQAPLPALARPVRALVTGDSTAQALGTGVLNWAVANPDLAQVEVQAALGCGLLTGGERKNGENLESVPACDDWVERLLVPAVERTQPDVVVVMVTTWDVLDHRWDGGDLLSPFDPAFQERLRIAYRGLVDTVLASGGTRVAFVREPVPDVWWQPEVNDQDQPERHAVLYDVFDELATEHPDVVSVIGLAEWFTAAGLDTDQDIRPDGIHLTPESSTTVADQFLGEQIVRAALGMETR
jgi:peptidoglycan/LPS O-acetylase OafA/YrhL